MIKQKLKFSAQSKVVIITIVLALILLCNVLAPYKEYIAGQILFAKDKLIYVKTDEEHSFKPTWNKMELVEKSTTPDDSVCIVSDMTKEQKKDWSEIIKYSDNGDSYHDMSFFNHMQRISSNQFVQISYTYKKSFIFAKDDKNKTNSDLENDGDRLVSIKLQTYDINSKKVIMDRELLNENLIKNRRALLTASMENTIISKSQEKKRPVIIIPFCSDSEHCSPFVDGIDEKSEILGRIEKRCFRGGRFDKCMDIKTLRKLLKQNGVDTKGVMCIYNIVDYNDINLMIKTENLPASNASLYKSYPKLKKYIGKKGKIARFYLKGLKNSDELVSYFLPEGQNVSYGDGIKVELDDGKKAKINSLDEYLANRVCEEDISNSMFSIPDNERLSADSFDFK